MFRVIIETGFSATHALLLPDRSREPLHGHDWRVRVTFSRRTLDSSGMVIDFVLAKELVEKVVAALHYRDLGEPGLLHAANPTAEVVAEWICRQLLKAGADTVEQVEVTEAPGCLALFQRDSM